MRIPLLELVLDWVLILGCGAAGIVLTFYRERIEAYLCPALSEAGIVCVFVDGVIISALAAALIRSFDWVLTLYRRDRDDELIPLQDWVLMLCCGAAGIVCVFADGNRPLIGLFALASVFNTYCEYKKAIKAPLLERIFSYLFAGLHLLFFAKFVMLSYIENDIIINIISKSSTQSQIILAQILLSLVLVLFMWRSARLFLEILYYLDELFWKYYFFVILVITGCGFFAGIYVALIMVGIIALIAAFTWYGDYLKRRKTLEEIRKIEKEIGKIEGEMSKIGEDSNNKGRELHDQLETVEKNLNNVDSFFRRNLYERFWRSIEQAKRELDTSTKNLSQIFFYQKLYLKLHDQRARYLKLYKQYSNASYPHSKNSPKFPEFVKKQPLLELKEKKEALERRRSQAELRAESNRDFVSIHIQLRGMEQMERQHQEKMNEIERQHQEEMDRLWDIDYALEQELELQERGVELQERGVELMEEEREERERRNRNRRR